MAGKKVNPGMQTSNPHTPVSKAGFATKDICSPVSKAAFATTSPIRKPTNTKAVTGKSC